MGLTQKSVTSAKGNVMGTMLFQYRKHDNGERIVKDLFGAEPMYKLLFHLLYIV